MQKSNWTFRVVIYWIVLTYISAGLMLSIVNPDYKLSLTPRYHLPAVIHFTNTEPPEENLYGFSVGPIVVIYKAHVDYPEKNPKMEIHELIHVEQWYETAGISSYIAAVSDRYRAHLECEAYAYQLLFTPINPKIGHKGDIDYITDMLVGDYEIESYSKIHLTAMISSLYEEFSYVPNDGTR